MFSFSFTKFSIEEAGIKQERVCSLKDRLGGGLYIDILSVKNVGIESIYRNMPYKKTLFLLYFLLLLGFW